MNVDLEKLNLSIRKNLSKLEIMKTRLEGGAEAIETITTLASELPNLDESDSPSSEHAPKVVALQDEEVRHEKVEVTAGEVGNGLQQYIHRWPETQDSSDGPDEVTVGEEQPNRPMAPPEEKVEVPGDPPEKPADQIAQVNRSTDSVEEEVKNSDVARDPVENPECYENQSLDSLRQRLTEKPDLDKQNGFGFSKYINGFL